MPVLNIKESDFLDRIKKLLEKDTKWEAHVAQQIPLARSSFPCPENRPGSLKQLEPKMDNDMDMKDFSERFANDKRPPKPKHDPSLMILIFFPSPLTCPNYVAITAAAAVEPTKPPIKEVRGILPEKKKVIQGWSTCLKRTPQKLHSKAMIFMLYTPAMMKTTTMRSQRKRKKPNKKIRSEEKRI